MVGEQETIFYRGPISWLTTLVHLVDVFTVLHTFSSLDTILCPELAIFMKELVVSRLVIGYIQIFGEPGLYTVYNFTSIWDQRVH